MFTKYIMTVGKPMNCQIFALVDLWCVNDWVVVEMKEDIDQLKLNKYLKILSKHLSSTILTKSLSFETTWTSDLKLSFFLNNIYKITWTTCTYFVIT